MFGMVTSMAHDVNFTGKVNWPSSVPMPMIMLGMSKIANHLSCNNFHVLQQTMCKGQDHESISCTMIFGPRSPIKMALTMETEELQATWQKCTQFFFGSGRIDIAVIPWLQSCDMGIMSMGAGMGKSEMPDPDSIFLTTVGPMVASTRMLKGLRHSGERENIRSRLSEFAISGIEFSLIRLVNQCQWMNQSIT